jgi:antitoxin component of RelBE/YafQ-DinJ toxin-antitoxin module
LDEGDISDSQVKTFYKAVRSFFEKAVHIKNLPLDKVIQNAEFVNFEALEAAAFVQVEYFIKRYVHYR